MDTDRERRDPKGGRDRPERRPPTSARKTTQMLIAYHGRQADKDAILAQLAGHRAADELVQGYGYWKDGKGCAVGCTIHSGDHMKYESQFGIPVAIARLEDRIFEELPVELARQWPERLMSTIQPGQDLSRVHWALLRWLLTTPDVNPGIENPIARDEVRQCAELMADIAVGRAVTASAAWNAAASAAWSAAESAAESEAWSAAESAAESVAASAAWSAAESVAENVASVARIAARIAASAAKSAESASSAAESALSPSSALSAARIAASAANAASSAASSAAWWSAASSASSSSSASSASRIAARIAARTASSAAWIKISDKLIDMIAEAPMHKED